MEGVFNSSGSKNSVRSLQIVTPTHVATDTRKRCGHKNLPTTARLRTGQRIEAGNLDCVTPGGRLHALAFTLLRRSPNFTGELSEAHYREIFASATGRYGSSLDYAHQPLCELRRHAIHDHALARLVDLAEVQIEASARAIAFHPPHQPHPRHGPA